MKEFSKNLWDFFPVFVHNNWISVIKLVTCAKIESPDLVLFGYSFGCTLPKACSHLPWCSFLYYKHYIFSPIRIMISKVLHYSIELQNCSNWTCWYWTLQCFQLVLGLIKCVRMLADIPQQLIYFHRRSVKRNTKHDNWFKWNFNEFEKKRIRILLMFWTGCSWCIQCRWIIFILWQRMHDFYHNKICAM